MRRQTTSIALLMTVAAGSLTSTGCMQLGPDLGMFAVPIPVMVHAQDMATRGYFDHTTPEGVTFDARITAAGYAWSRAAENIAAGQRDPAAVMAAWMDSAGHRRNILAGFRTVAC